MTFLLLAAALPALYTEEGPHKIEAAKAAGIACVKTTAVNAAAWKAKGACAEAADVAARAKMPPPKVEYRMNVASATSTPWVTANGWRYLRDATKPVRYDDATPLAAAEAFAYSADALLAAPPATWNSLGKMLAFLAKVPPSDMPALANIGFEDDGSAQSSELMNLLSRRNLLFRVVKSPDRKLDLNLKPAPGDPFEYANDARYKLKDVKRLVRIYGYETIVARLTGSGGKARLHLLNYGRSPAEGPRVLVRGPYKHAAILQYPEGRVEPRDPVVKDGVIEFSVPMLDTYAVIDLK